MQGPNILNFRISDPLKGEFQVACRQLQTNMTAELNRMIRTFVQEHPVNTDDMRPLKWFSSKEWRSK
jgi:hypothetical protein